MDKPGARNRARIYLAGPEVFLPDATAFGRRKVEICAAHGLEGVFPLDNQFDLDGLDRREQARRISLANEEAMRSSDAAIANLTPFRGVSMDAGTAFEVGFMRALGRPVFGYTTTAADYAARAHVYRNNGPLAFDYDAPGHEVEDFGLAENLMIPIAIAETGGLIIQSDETGDQIRYALHGFTAAVEAAARHFSQASA
jgi:nucleoside 2-deoxyribosyltransferase